MQDQQYDPFWAIIYALWAIYSIEITKNGLKMVLKNV